MRCTIYCIKKKKLRDFVYILKVYSKLYYLFVLAWLNEQTHYKKENCVNLNKRKKNGEVEGNMIYESDLYIAAFRKKLHISQL